MPNTSFQCSGQAVPFSTAVYTNANLHGESLMGPYLPLVGYVDPNPTGSLAMNGPGIPMLPDPGYCGKFTLPNTNVGPGLSTTSMTNQETFPKQFWPNGTGIPPYLNCLTTTPAPQAYFAATQLPEPIPAWETLNGNENCGQSYTPPASNPCNQIILPGTQTTELSGGTAFQPAPPLTLVGMGFGNLPNATLPLAVQNSSYLLVEDCPNGGINPSELLELLEHRRR